jgi:hypothetical protein
MSTSPTTSFPVVPRSLRERILERVNADLLGPAGGKDEIVDEGSLRDRYLVGLLAPRGTSSDPGEDDDLSLSDDDSDEPGEPRQAAPTSLMPSAIGLTFRVESAAAQLLIHARWGRYRRVDHPTEERGRVWQREAAGGSLTLPLVTGSAALGAPDPTEANVVLDARVRGGDDKPWIVTVFLRNEQETPSRSPDEAWLFQVEVEVRSPSGDAVFIGQPERASDDDPEQQALAIAYRNRREFAVGHGVAVEADVVDGDASRTSRLVTRALPVVELPQMLPPEASPDSADEELRLLSQATLDMRRLAGASDEELPSMLLPLPDAYAKWLDRNAERAAKSLDGLSEDSEAAQAVLARGRDAHRRLDDAIKLLRGDGDVRDAFRFAMSAMADQRVHGIWAKARRQDATTTLDEFDVPGNYEWRPFQLAFVLLNLRALAEPTAPERSDPNEAIVDLLWFPTGGGKTEAYLGLTAFALAIRRLRPELGDLDGGAGVTVLMRYTLRVLTLQQFQRASALLCACELQRREAPKRWGVEPFRIGLWVGAATTPNTIDKANEAIMAARRGELYTRGTPHQLPNCPWCGHAIDPGRDIIVSAYDSGEARALTYCGDQECQFNQAQSPGEGLPLMTVDEEIYRRLPSVLIATVDKFARLPWVGATQALFGIVDRFCPRHGYLTPGLDDGHPKSHPAKGKLPAVTVEPAKRLRPPDLIIQDELHLIAGPLGSLVGLYETAVDALMSWSSDGVPVRPKIVASTATIRRADAQAYALYLRRLAIFPPPALDAEDSFFARERPIGDDAPGRMYVGVCAPGRRLKAVLIRVYVALLAAAQQVYEDQEERVDPWMTLVGYFTSIRELAGMRRLCEDDVRTRLRDTEIRGLANRDLRSSNIEELTSRLAATKIPATLDRIERPFPAPSVPMKDRDSVDVLLATNMISVGVDVERLGLMVVAGQPKTTSEYIQATSRVGRSVAGPGLVVTVYNWARPRDLSHYERFFHDHRTAYAQVEPLTVTPFASRARDRGLAAVFASLVRLGDPIYNANKAAHAVPRDTELVKHAMEAIVARAEGVTADSDVGDQVRGELQRAVDEWQARIDHGKQTGAPLVYESDDGTALLQPLEKGFEDTSFTCPNSLRDVEPSVGLLLLERADQ